MSRFNTVTRTPVVENRAGGASYALSPKNELVHLLLTSFLKDMYYEKADDRIGRLQGLMKTVDPLFAAKAAIYAREQFHMRSVTHVLAGEIGRNVKGEEWTKHFFERIVSRPDDMTEILAYYRSTGEKAIPNAMKKGFAEKLTSLDAYRLGKYQGKGKAFSLVDVVNLVHPYSTEQLSQLMSGDLPAPETWEVLLTQAGSDAAEKAAVWKKLLSEDKLGYMALLRNLRNIRDQAPTTLSLALDQLMDPERVTKSKVLPFRFATAISQFSESSPLNRVIVSALNVAMNNALANVPNLGGRTVVLLDTSGSMGHLSVPSSHLSIGSMFAAAVAKVNNADLKVWATHVADVPYNLDDSIGTIRENMVKTNVGMGTNLSQAIDSLSAHYDRIVVFSDFQSWADRNPYGDLRGPADRALNAYRARTDSNPIVYSFDLAGYGDLSFKPNKVVTLAGFSDKVFDLMASLEKGEDALTKEIEAVAF